MANVGYPNFDGKHAQDALFSPEDATGQLHRDGSRPLPDAVILTYGHLLISELERRGVQRTDGYPGPWRSLWFVESGERKVAIAGGFGVGAPGAAMVMEELIALGVREFLSIGAAGCLQPRCAFGQIVVCTGAIRDEGVSHHYEATAKFAYPSEALTARLTSVLTGDGGEPEAGLAWTIDAPYRETVVEARSYSAEGIVCVEMEAAALLTVAKYRGVDGACAFVVSDHLLAEDRWTHAFGSEQLHSGLVRLLDASIETLSRGLPQV